MIHCASLIYFEKGKLLLVRVRQNKLWYFPGGKIAENEAPRSALVRELFEELNVVVKPEKLSPIGNIVAPNHTHTESVQLYLYALDYLAEVNPSNEVSEAKWFDCSETDLMAPGVIKALRYINNGS